MDKDQEIEIQYKDRYNTPTTFKGNINQCIRHLISLS